jgi:hypothetical protein
LVDDDVLRIDLEFVQFLHQTLGLIQREELQQGDGDGAVS